MPPKKIPKKADKVAPSKQSIEDEIQKLQECLKDYAAEEEEKDKAIPTPKSEVRECKICSVEVTKQNMARHVQTVHMKLKKFKCKSCGKRFTTKKNVKNHESNCEDESDEENPQYDPKPIKLKMPQLSLVNLQQLQKQPMNAVFPTSTYIPKRSKDADENRYSTSRNRDGYGNYYRRSNSRSRSRSKSRYYGRNKGRHSRQRHHRSPSHSRSRSRSCSRSRYGSRSPKLIPRPDNAAQVDVLKQACIMADKAIANLMELSQFLVASMSKIQQ